MPMLVFWFCVVLQLCKILPLEETENRVYRTSMYIFVTFFESITISKQKLNSHLPLTLPKDNKSISNNIINTLDNRDETSIGWKNKTLKSVQKKQKVSKSYIFSKNIFKLLFVSLLKGAPDSFTGEFFQVFKQRHLIFN